MPKLQPRLSLNDDSKELQAYKYSGTKVAAT